MYLVQTRFILKIRIQSTTALIYVKSGSFVTSCYSEHFDTKKSEIKVHGEVQVPKVCVYVFLHLNNDEKCVTWAVVSLNLQPIQLGKINKKKFQVIPRKFAEIELIIKWLKKLKT